MRDYRRENYRPAQNATLHAVGVGLFWGFLSIFGACTGEGSASSASTPGSSGGAGEADPGAVARCEGEFLPGAGLPSDMECPPGELPVNGDCTPAGVPPDACGPGFMPDEERGCKAILPPGPCPAGLIAIPGDTECREIGTCGDGTYGDIVIEAGTQFVDAGYKGNDGNGTQEKPWTNIQAAINAATPGAMIAVAAGTYAGDLKVIGKAVRIYGRCASMVHITGAGDFAAVDIRSGAHNAEVHDVAVTGPTLGVGISGAKSVVLERVWIHHTGDRALDIENVLGPTEVFVTGSLIESAGNLGVAVVGSEVTIETSAIRDTIALYKKTSGRGVSVQANTNGTTSDVTIRSSLIERCSEMGIYISAGVATIEATAVRDIDVNGYKEFGRGINVRDDAMTGQAAHVDIKTSSVERSHDFGIFADSSVVTIEHTTVRGTLPINLSTGFEGGGVLVRSGNGPEARANGEIRWSLIASNAGLGVAFQGADATIEGVIVRDTTGNAFGLDAAGVRIADDSAGARGNLKKMSGSLVEGNQGAGIFVAGADALIMSTIVRDSRVDANGTSGRGVNVQVNPSTGVRAAATLSACIVERNHEVGVAAIDADLVLDHTIVRDTLPDDYGHFGRGVVVQGHPTTGEQGTGLIQSCRIEHNVEVGLEIITADATVASTVVCGTTQNAKGEFGCGIFVIPEYGPAVAHIADAWVGVSALVGIASYGVEVDLQRTQIVCNGNDLQTESYKDGEGSFGVLNKNGILCGCPEATGECQVESDSEVFQIPPHLPPKS